MGSEWNKTSNMSKKYILLFVYAFNTVSWGLWCQAGVGMTFRMTFLYKDNTSLTNTVNSKFKKS